MSIHDHDIPLFTDLRDYKSRNSVYSIAMPTENRYAWLFRRLPVIATLMDAEGRFTDVSDAWISRLGYGREEIRGMFPQDIATAESARQIREEHLPLFKRTGRLDHVPVDFITKDGEEIEIGRQQEQDHGHSRLDD